MSVNKELIFPECIVYGSTFASKYDTNKLQVGGGKEYRVSEQDYPRHVYSVDFENAPAAEHLSILTLWHAASGELDGFLFLDPYDHTSNNRSAALSSTDTSYLDQFVAVAAGEAYAYPLYKTYKVNAQEKQRRVYYPIEGTLKVAVDGYEVTNFVYSYSNFTLSFLQSIAEVTLRANIDGDTLVSSFFDEVPAYAVNDLVYVSGFTDSTDDRTDGEHPYRVLSRDDTTLQLEYYDGTQVNITDTGLTLSIRQAPIPTGSVITCGFYFRTPVRFDDNELSVSSVAGLRETSISDLRSVSLVEVCPL